MKNIKKIYLETITMVIVGLLITSTASIIAQEPQTSENKVITQVLKTNIKPTNLALGNVLENKIFSTQPSNTVGVNLFPGITPAISNSGSAMVIGYNSIDLENIYFSASTDLGSTWTEGMGWSLNEPPELPSIDGCGDGRFIGGMVPNGLDADGGAGYYVQISDVLDFEAGYYCAGYTWNDVGSGYTNFIDVECGGYTAADAEENTYAFGGYSIIGDHGDLGDQTGFFSYVCNAERTAWIYTLAENEGDFNDATSTAMDIDQDTLYSYAVYNCNSNETFDLYLFIMDFGQWGEYSGYPIHENNWGAYLTTAGNDKNLDISAFQDNVIIVSERDGNIIAYHTDDASQDPTNITFSEVTITTGGKPRIAHYGDNKAVCEYIKNGVVYSTLTEDGGATWSTSEEVSEEESIQNTDVCPMGSAYESDNTIYYAPMDFKQPIIKIESVTGSIGIKAVVKNVGTGTAENIDWSFVTDGTVFVGKEKSGQIPTLAPNESVTISTGLMLGFGAITTTITAGSATKTVNGKLLLLFVTGLA